MRIAIVSETYPPEINGVALTVHGLATGMAARGHAVDVVRPRQPTAFTDDAGIDTLEVRGASLPRYPGLRFGLPAARVLTQRWTRDRPDALYVATEGPLGWSAMRTARKLGIPTATGFHTRFDKYAEHYGVGWLTPVLRGHLRRFHNGGSATLVPTQALAAELATLGIDNAHLLRRAVDTVQFNPGRRSQVLRARWGVLPDTPVVLYVGRIAAEKNLALAVRSFRALQEHRPDAHYVWVGDGPERAALAAANPDFIFAGMQRGDDLAASFASADLFVFPSLSETFGNVILESLASGVPVVAYDEGAAREHIVDGVNGIRVDRGNERSFMRRTVCVASDMGNLRAMGRAAQQGVARLAPAAVIGDFEHLLQQLTREPRHERLAATATA